MASELRDRLTDLADHMPSGAPPPDLWRRGVRRRRLGQAATSVLVVALVLVLGAGFWSWGTSQQHVTPVAPQGTPHLPDRFFTPSPWLPTFDQPPGHLVAVGTARHKTLLKTRDDVYGITASTGEYGFLDLQDLAARQDNASAVPPALSPDGRYVGYWVTGTPSGSANTELYGQTITGVAIYDATTGQVRVARLPTTHGLAPVDLTWSDSRTLVMSVGQIAGGDGTQRSSTWQDVRLVGWRLEDARPTPLDVPEGVDGSDRISAGRGFVLAAASGHGQRWLVWPREPSLDREIHAPPGNATPVASPGGAALAGVVGNRNPNHLVVGSIPPGPGRVTMHAVNATREYYRPIAWTDHRHVVALVRNPYRNVPGPITARLDLVDVETGSARTLVDHLPGGGNAWAALSFATDLLTAPPTHASAPPAPWDRRAIALGLLIGTALLVGVLLVERRRRGRRA